MAKLQQARHWPEAREAFAEEPHTNGATPSVDELEKNIGDLARVAAEEAKTALPAAPVTPDRVRLQIVATVDLARQHVIDTIKSLRDQLDELEQLVACDGDRVKNELIGHLDLANAATLHLNEIGTTIRNVRAGQARIVRGEATAHGN